MFRRVPWPFWTAGVAAAAVLVWLFDRSGGAIACGMLPVRVVGVVTDATTGAPVVGASLLTLIDPEIARRPEDVQMRREHARMYEGLSRQDLVRSASTWGSARTDGAGAFEIVVGIGTSETTGRLGITRYRERGSAAHVARALLVEKEGYVPLVHETKDARWEERQEGEIVGTLDVGTIRLEPARSR